MYYRVMPSRNIVKLYDVNTYYHIYNRGIEKRKIFLDGEDYAVFLNLLKRYLDKEPVKDSKGREYFWLANDLQVVAFCLMPNHFHILLYQIEKDAMTKLLRAVCTSYTTYFNKKINVLDPCSRVISRHLSYEMKRILPTLRGIFIGIPAIIGAGSGQVCRTGWVRRRRNGFAPNSCRI